MSKKVVIIDFQLGNLFSVHQACLNFRIDAVISSDKSIVLNADAIILPGVGAFGDAMNSLIKLDLVKPIQDFVSGGKPFMGVCLGLQLLFTESEEFGSHKGLNIIKGTVKKFPAFDSDHLKIRVPQIAWNQISQKKTWSRTPLKGIREEEYMYFVHSYYVCPENTDDTLAETTYGGLQYCSAVSKNNIFATQFHPEKSAAEGLKIYKNWIEMI